MKCSACGRELTKKDVLYTEDRRPFCRNPFECNDEHPNSVKNIIERQGTVQMYSEEELERDILESLEISDEMKERIVKLSVKPQSIRLSRVVLPITCFVCRKRKVSLVYLKRSAIELSLAMQVEPVEHTFTEESATEEVIKVADVPPAPPKTDTKNEEELVF